MWGIIFDLNQIGNLEEKEKNDLFAFRISKAKLLREATEIKGMKGEISDSWKMGSATADAVMPRKVNIICLTFLIWKYTKLQNNKSKFISFLNKKENNQKIFWIFLSVLLKKN